jgi:ribosomal protein L24
MSTVIGTGDRVTILTGKYRGFTGTVNRYLNPYVKGPNRYRMFEVTVMRNGNPHLAAVLDKDMEVHSNG